MAPRRNPTPSYLKHSRTGRARAVWSDSSGKRHDVLLPGRYESEESKQAFARIVAEQAASPVVPLANPTGLSVAELLNAYRKWAEVHYRGPDGKPSDEVRQLYTVCRFVRELYGLTPATEFGPLALKAVREQFVAAGWCRKTVNDRVDRIRRIFRWGVAEQLIPAAVLQSLIAVEGLKKGRTPARETEPIKPVDDATVEAVLPYLNRHVRGLVEFQRLTGCRPGEACSIRRADIDMSGDVWVYEPKQHKGTWRDKSRPIPIGPKAQALLRDFFTPDAHDYLFSPQRAVEEVRAARAARRKTPLYPSHQRHNKARQAKRKGMVHIRPPAERYNRGSYETAVDRACDAAFPPPAPLAQREGESKAKWWARLTEKQQGEVKAWRKAHRWSPNQIRHAHGTKVRKMFGLEAAQCVLGHEKADITQIYAERNLELATEVARKVG